MKLIEVIIFVLLLLIVTAGIAQSFFVIRPALETSARYSECYDALNFICNDFKNKTQEGYFTSEKKRRDWGETISTLFALSNHDIIMKKAQREENIYICIFTFVLDTKQYEMLSVYEGLL